LKQSLIILTFVFSIVHSFGQKMSNKAIENTLNKSYGKILSYWEDTRSKGGEAAEDSLERQDSLFRTQLQRYTLKYPQTLNYSFDTLQNNVNIATSTDKLFRIYSWDTWEGGTEHDFENVFQYKSGNKVYSYSVYDTSFGEDIYVPYYTNIYTLKSNDKTYYLAIACCIYGTMDQGESIKIFDIEDNHVKDVKLIKTSTHFTNEISFSYDFLKMTGWPNKYSNLIKYDANTEKIYIPIVNDDNDEKVTNKFIVYKFNGNYFEKQKEIFTGNMAFLSK
jgi:hypothetical protein